ncbi:MAG: DUF2225 domain-containing protein [Acaryochloris sp. CRU_2_0]|nr:DUF2225 domain-containing protein [Acaryochloris sp. CRU_2_0]
MKKIFIGFLILGLSLSGLGLSLPQPSVAQAQIQQAELLKLKRLQQQAYQQNQEGQPKQAISTLQQALLIARQNSLKEIEASILFIIGGIYSLSHKTSKALEYYDQALPIYRAVNDKMGEVSTLKIIAHHYSIVEQPQKALKYYTQALFIIREIKNRKEEAKTLNNIASVYFSIDEPQKALEYYTQSLPIFREVNNRKGEAETLNEIASVYSRIDQPKRALEYYTQSLLIFRGVKGQKEEAITLYGMGKLYFQIGQLQEALEYFRQGLFSFKIVNNQQGEAQVLLSIGEVYSRLGQPEKSLESYNQALAILRQANEETVEDEIQNGEAILQKMGEAIILHRISMTYTDMNQLQKALEYNTQALLINRAMKFRKGEAITLSSMGVFYSYVSQLQKALEYYNQALSVCRAIKDRQEEAKVLSNIGVLYTDIGQPQKALKYYNQALPIYRVANDPHRGVTLSNIGSIYAGMNQLQKALEHYNQALSISRAIKDRNGEAMKLNKIGWVYYKTGQLQTVLEYYNQALPIFREVQNRRDEAASLYNLAILERSRGNLEAALQHIDDAINIIETTRTEIVSQEFRTSYFTSQRAYYDFYIDLLMQLHKQQPSKGFNARALEKSERARARSLIDLLRESQADIRQGVDPKLLEQEKNLQFQFNALEKRRLELGSKTPTKAQITSFEREYDTLLSQDRDLETQIRSKSPRYAALTQPKPLTIAEIQQQVLDNNTVLLEYSLGKERSYLWAVTQSGIISYELPKQSEIEAATNKFLNIVQDSNAKLSDISRTGTPLSQMLLGPVAQQLGQKRLLVVSDGALQYLPFAALPAPKGSQFLLSEHEIINLPSASTLATLRQELNGRKPAPKTVAVFADPVFSPTDERVGQRKGRTSASNKPTQGSVSAESFSVQTLRDASQKAGMNFEALPGTRREAEAILQLLPANTKMQALDFEANKTKVLDSNLSQYRIVHFATHGILNTTRPELSAVVLSLVDPKGRPENGFLRLRIVA